MEYTKQIEVLKKAADRALLGGEESCKKLLVDLGFMTPMGNRTNHEFDLDLIEEFGFEGYKPEKQTIAATFEELRKITGGYWDSVKCVCAELGKSKCELNCPEYK